MARTEIAVLSLHRHPRLRYVLGECSRMLGCHFRLFLDLGKYQSVAVAARINYGAPPSGVAELAVAASDFLAGKDSSVQAGDAAFFRYLAADFWLPPPIQTDTGWKTGTAGPKRVCAGTHVQEQGHSFRAVLAEADPFAAVFFCLSRWEEYQPGPRDQHGRFSAQQSHAFRNNYLERPVVHEILLGLENALKAAFPDFYRPPAPPLQLFPTYDIDLPFAYLHRGWRGLAAGLLDVFRGQGRRSWARWRCLWAQQADPYNTFQWLQSLHQRLGLPARFFCLLAERQTRQDPNPSPQHPVYRSLLRSLAEWADMGIHPSYYSSEEGALIRQEKAYLIDILGQPVTHSRQHFLRFSLPHTYRELLLAGITQDYSMGYADAIGWRAGTHQAFRWYDLEAEEASGLWVHPFAAMDVTLLKYENLAPASEATAKNKESVQWPDNQKIGLPTAAHPRWAVAAWRIKTLYEGVQPYGGAFILLWHNSSFAEDYGWGGWQKMYEELLEKLSKPDFTPQKDL